jgi:hypothetical protein
VRQRQPTLSTSAEASICAHVHLPLTQYVRWKGTVRSTVRLHMSPIFGNMRERHALVRYSCAAERDKQNESSLKNQTLNNHPYGSRAGALISLRSAAF